MKNKRKRRITVIVVVLIIIASVLLFVLWKINENKPTPIDESMFACNRDDSYKVAITISPGNVVIKNDIKQSTYKKVTDVKIENQSSCTQLIKITSMEPLVIDQNNLIIKPNSEKILPLSIDIPRSYKAGSYNKYLLFETITPNEDQKIILKNNYGFNIVKTDNLNIIQYFHDKYPLYFYLGILLLLIIILIIYLMVRQKKSKSIVKTYDSRELPPRHLK